MEPDIPPSPEPAHEHEPDLEPVFAEAETLFNNFKKQCSDFQQVREGWAERQVEEYSQPEKQHQLQEKLVALELDLFEEFSNSLSQWTRQKFELLGKQEEFWQFVRYAGLGFVLGIVAKALLR
jgi:hypothetical protein